MVLIGKFEVGFSELNRKETDNLLLLLSVFSLCRNGLLNFICLFIDLFILLLCWVFVGASGLLLLRSMGSKAHKLSSFEGLVALRHVGC